MTNKVMNVRLYAGMSVNVVTDPFTDKVVRPKPAVTVPEAAGSVYADPMFGSLILRVTDTTTNAGRSCRMQSNVLSSGWNTNSTRFTVMGENGNAMIFAFDGVKATLLPVNVPSQTEPSFSFVDPDKIYGVVQHKVRVWSLATGAYTVALDVDAAYPQLALGTNTYIGGVQTSDNDVWVIYFGGTGQDHHTFVHHSVKGLLDTRPLGFNIHNIALDRSGRYVLVFPAINPATGQLDGPQVFIWDTETGSVSPLTTLPGGHGGLGYGQYINQTCCTSTPWDAAQWQIRELATPNVTRDLIPAAQMVSPKEIYLADHGSWRCNKPGPSLPYFSSTYRFAAGAVQPYTPAWRAWDDEIISIATDGSGLVKRYCHHQSVAWNADGSANDYWNQPNAHVDPSGKYVAFTSNWGRTLGVSNGLPRQDVFVVFV